MALYPGIIPIAAHGNDSCSLRAYIFQVDVGYGKGAYLNAELLAEIQYSPELFIYTCWFTSLNDWVLVGVESAKYGTYMSLARWEREDMRYLRRRGKRSTLQPEMEWAPLNTVDYPKSLSQSSYQKIGIASTFTLLNRLKTTIRTMGPYIPYIDYVSTPIIIYACTYSRSNTRIGIGLSRGMTLKFSSLSYQVLNPLILMWTPALSLYFASGVIATSITMTTLVTSF